MRLAVIADTHVTVGDRARATAAWHNSYRLEDSLDRLMRALDHPLVRRADALFVLGDLVHFGDAESLDAVLRVLSGWPGPVVAISGNHDVIEPDVRLEREIAATAARVWSPCCPGEPEAVVALFGEAGIGLQVVDVVSEWPAPEQPFGVVARTVVSGDAGGPGVTLTHFPLLGFQRRIEAAGFLYSGHLDQLANAPDLDRGWGAHLVLNGHLHLRAVEQQGTTLQLSMAALVEAPYEVAAVVVERRAAGLDVFYDCASLHDVTEAHVPVFAPARCEWSGFPGA